METPKSSPDPRHSQERNPDSTYSSGKPRSKWIWIISFLILITGGYFILHGDEKAETAKKAKPAPKAVPVSMMEAKEGDIGIYLSGLGTVTPVQTVNIISRVQGQITHVNYREGQAVHKGDSLVEIDARPYEAAVMQAEGQFARDQALLKEAQINLKRYREAYQKRAIAKQQLDDQEQLVFQDQGVVKTDEGTLANARVNVEYCHIASPIEGRVGLRLIDAGNMVQANSTTPLAVVTQIQPIDVVFTLPEDQLSQVQTQLQKGKTLTVDAYDRSQQNKIASGKLLTLDNVIDPTTGTVKLKAEFANEHNELFPNQFVNAKLLVDTEKNQTLVPLASVQRETDGAYVYVIDQNQTAKMVKVTVGAADGNLTAVSGLKVDEPVVTDGFDKLQDGAKVQVRQQAQKKPLGSEDADPSRISAAGHPASASPTP
jgi:multidrug efflux system membrane fusion protein